MPPVYRFVPHKMVRYIIPFHGLETAMTRSKTIDLKKVPSDPWGCREYLLSEYLPLVLEASKEHIQNRYKAREQLEASASSCCTI